MNTGPIGVFDSGIGGLSILRALRSLLPHEDFHYIADAAHAPYGERGDPFVTTRAHAVTQALVAAHGAKLVVVACNTATAAAVHSLRLAFPRVPIVGVEPALKPALVRTRNGRIGVMATRTTLASAKFQALLEALRGQAEFRLQACDGLADAIEHGDAAQVETLGLRYLQALGLPGAGAEAPAPDTVVLGCTHYPLVLHTLKVLAGPAVEFVEPGEAVARRVQSLLHAQGLARGRGLGRLTLESTGDGPLLEAAARRYLSQ